jgi:hypothetical protein
MGVMSVRWKSWHPPHPDLLSKARFCMLIYSCNDDKQNFYFCK